MGIAVRNPFRLAADRHTFNFVSKEGGAWSRQVHHCHPRLLMLHASCMPGWPPSNMRVGHSAVLRRHESRPYRKCVLLAVRTFCWKAEDVMRVDGVKNGFIMTCRVGISGHQTPPPHAALVQNGRDALEAGHESHVMEMHMGRRAYPQICVVYVPEEALHRLVRPALMQEEELHVCSCDECRDLRRQGHAIASNDRFSV